MCIAMPLTHSKTKKWYMKLQCTTEDIIYIDK